MKNQLIIENFRSWRGVNYVDLNRINLIFGSNSSGKSSILHAIALLKQSWRAGQMAALANLQPKGSEIDLGRIEDQISKPFAKEKLGMLGFGLRFYDKHKIFQDVSRRKQFRDLARRFTKQMELDFRKFDALLPSPVDLHTRFNKDGELNSVELKSAGHLIFGLKINQLANDISFQFVFDEEAPYWEHAIDWVSMVEAEDDISPQMQAGQTAMKGNLETIEERISGTQRLVRQARVMVNKDPLSSFAKVRLANLQSKLHDLRRRKLRLEHDINDNELQSELSKPFFARESISSTKESFFEKLNEPFSLPVDTENNLNLAPVLDPYFLNQWYTRREREVKGAPIAAQALEACLSYVQEGCIFPTEIMQTMIAHFCRFIDSSDRIGPHRDRPDRITFVNPGDRVSRVGSQGENVVPIIYKASPADLRIVNSWLEKLEIDYSIKRRFTKRYNIAELRLIDSDRHEISLSDVGYGVGQILPVLISAILQKDALICIEQPELHLHPRLQANLIDLFIWSAKERNNVFLLETHSEHVVLRLQRRQRELWESKGLSNASDAQTREPQRRRSNPLTEMFIAAWRSLPDSVSMQIVTLEENPRRSVITSVELNSEGEFKDVWPGDFFPERFAEKGLI